MQVPSTMTHVTSLMYYLPTKPAVTAQVLKGGPEYTVFAKETLTARGADHGVRGQLPQGFRGHLDRDPGRDLRVLVRGQRAAASAVHHFRDT